MSRPAELPFEPADRPGAVRVHLDAGSRHLVAEVMDDVARLLDPAEPDDAHPPAAGSSGEFDWVRLEAELQVDPPTDPAVARLLPDGHRDDPDLAQSYRRLTEHTLRERKQTGLGRAASALRRDDPVVLAADEASDLLKALTDVRLVLADRIGLRTDEDAEALHLHVALLQTRAEVAGLAALPEPEQHWLSLSALYEELTWWQEALIGALH
ncbi:MAG: DUF2017 family protein [Kineosporiaceae bacterium]